MLRTGRTLLVLLLAVAVSGCPSITDAIAGGGKKTYQSLWINASWSGGRTGTPLESKGVTPTGIIGSYCPVNSVVLLNHYATYGPQGLDNSLVINSNCSSLIMEVALCATAGSGGTGNSFGICGVDPRKTSPNNLLIYPLPPNSTRNPWGRTGLSLDVNIFYCATGSHMNLGEVSGKDATDCVVD